MRGGVKLNYVADKALREFHHLKRSAVVGFFGKACGGHVGVADCLDFFYALALGPFVKLCYHRVKHSNNFVGAHSAAHLGKADDVGEQDRRVGEFFGYRAVWVFGKLGRHFLGKNVQQKLFGLFVRYFKVARSFRHFLLQLNLVALHRSPL